MYRAVQGQVLRRQDLRGRSDYDGSGLVRVREIADRGGEPEAEKTLPSEHREHSEGDGRSDDGAAVLRLRPRDRVVDAVAHVHEGLNAAGHRWSLFEDHGMLPTEFTRIS